jgi:hypothetical protein
MATRKALHDSSPERGAARTINNFCVLLVLCVLYGKPQNYYRSNIFAFYCKSLNKKSPNSFRYGGILYLL